MASFVVVALFDVLVNLVVRLLTDDVLVCIAVLAIVRIVGLTFILIVIVLVVVVVVVCWGWRVSRAERMRAPRWERQTGRCAAHSGADQ